MGTLINDKLAETRGIAEAELDQVNAQITGSQASIVKLEARKKELEDLIAEFVKDFPAVTAKAVSLGDLRRNRF